jgi:hypothetical protein
MKVLLEVVTRNNINMKAFEYLGSGRHRAVWRHGKYVIKIPINENGIYDNWHERDTWKQYGESGGCFKYARCRLLGNILIMEYASYPGPLSDENGYIPLQNCPEWAYSLDCHQVGYNQKGAIVAYDYGAW